MKKSDDFINKSVFKVNLKYTRLQNETKELFFRCLDEGRTEKYFSKQLDKIWGNLDHSFMNSDIEEYKRIIHDNNLQLFELAMPKTEKQVKKEDSFFDIISAVVVMGYEKKFVKQQEKEYRKSLESPLYKDDKREYLKLLVPKKDVNGIVPYYVKKTGKIREVSLNTYASMIHNTNLTRSAWNQSLNDAREMGVDKFYIPFHNFSCPDCLDHQNRVMTFDEVIDLIGEAAEEMSGNVLHPNCKCVLTHYYPGLTQIDPFIKQHYSYDEKVEQYKIRQKMNSITLKKERLKTDMKIQERLGNKEEYDKLNQKRNKLNAQIRELKHELPTAELQTQVVAINRNYNASYYDQS